MVRCENTGRSSTAARRAGAPESPSPQPPHSLAATRLANEVPETAGPGKARDDGNEPGNRSRFPGGTSREGACAPRQARPQPQSARDLRADDQPRLHTVGTDSGQDEEAETRCHARCPRAHSGTAAAIGARGKAESRSPSRAGACASQDGMEPATSP
ncbi:hypothetical protein P7K49_032420, partial [Saguinus oedipus]